MLYPASPQGLNNINIGGPENHQVGVRFLAQHSSPLAAVRFYEINEKAGYAGGTGGTLMYELCEDVNGFPGPAIAKGTYINDSNFTEWLNAGGFPLIGFPTFPVLKAQAWYHFVITNIDPHPTINFVSADFLISKTGVNPDPLSSVEYRTGTTWTVYKSLMASPFGVYYANGLAQGNGGYQLAANGTTLCGGAYGFGMLC